ncbi:MAG: hypothetical protein FRX49_01777 [Trebouxia sp. A1-2]|nr:MAG: hypothetical protein FRX49_01777 [Trebouxia sp. A1-2]
MATRQARRDANKEGKLYSVKTGFNTIFTHPGLAATTLQAVQLVSPILIASNVLANLHVLRCLETTAGDVPKLDQTFFSNCMYAVTHATGHKAVQFNRAKNGELTESLDIYLQQLPQGHQPLERPTLIKDILNAASLMARTNFKNHIVTNYFSRTLSWIRLQLGQQAFFANMDSRIASSWAKFVCRAAADNITNIWDLLPRYTSLAQPPQHIMDDLENLVATMQQLMGPLPVTEWSLQRRPESYLPWLQLVLKDFEEAQDTPDAPKLFSMLPQSNNNTKFITISSTSLQKLLLATGIANVPSLTAKAGAKEFTQHQESWWNQYTDCISFSKRAQQSRRRFKFQAAALARSFIKRQQAYSAICKEISGGRKDTVVAYGDAKFSSSCCKGNPSTPTVSLRRKVGHCCQRGVAKIADPTATVCDCVSTQHVLVYCGTGT